MPICFISSLQLSCVTEVSRTPIASQRRNKLEGNLEKHIYLEKTNFKHMVLNNSLKYHFCKKDCNLSQILNTNPSNNTRVMRPDSSNSVTSKISMHSSNNKSVLELTL